LSLEWKSCKIGDLGKIFSGGTPSTKIEEYWNGNLNWLSSGETRNTYIYSTDKYITEKGAENSSTKLANKGDIVIASAGQGFTRGQSSMVMIDTFVNQSVIVIHPNEKVNNHYLLYNLKFRYPELRQLSDHASTRGSLTTKIIKGLDINLPDLNTQNKIATIIQYFDKKIETDKRINKNLLQLSKVIFKNWFVDFEPFGGVQPNDWRISALEEVCDLNAGGDKPEVVSDEITDSCIYPIYSNGLDNDGLYGYTNHAKIFEECVTVSARGTIGFVCLRHTPYVPIVRLVSVIPKKEFISAKYLYLYLDRLNIIGTGTTQQQLTIPDFKKTEILVPTLDIIESFTNYLNPLFEKIWVQEEEIKKLSKLRDTLLPKLMSGEIDVSKINCDLYFLLYLYLIYCDKFN